LLAFCVLALFASASAQSTIDPAGEYDFKAKGFPTMCFLGGITLLAWATWSGYSTSGAADTRSSTARVFLGIQVLLIFGAIFFVFGPGHAAASGYGGAGPAANILGLLFFFSASLGLYAHFTDSNSHLLGWFVLAVAEILALLGLLPLLGLGVSIVELNQAACLLYFRAASLDRCANDGYLQLLRTWGIFLVFGLVVGVTNTIHRVQFTLSNVRAHSSGGSPSAYAPPHGYGNEGYAGAEKDYHPSSGVPNSAPIRTPSPASHADPLLAGGQSFQNSTDAAPRPGDHNFTAI